MFTACVFGTVEYRNKTFHNSPINLSLVTHVSKADHHEYPEISGVGPAPALKFHLVNDKTQLWVFSRPVDRDSCLKALISTEVK